MPPVNTGYWMPPVAPKQLELLARCAPNPKRKKYFLVSGPRRSGKTLAALHSLAHNAWETDNGYITIVSTSVSAAADGGVWVDLTKSILPQWINAGFGMEWITEPRLEGASKKHYCEVSNKYGSKTRIQLDSLQNESEVEHRFKQKRYSLIYVTELSNFKQRKTFDIMVECLRMPHLTPWQHLLLCDTNPADEGEQSWIWKLWYNDRLKENPSPEERPLLDQLELMEMFVGDNTFLTPEELALQKAQYHHNQDLYDRYYLGKWVTASTGAIFNEVLRPDFHFVGDDITIANPTPDMLLPEENCIELGSGWDMGTVNSAGVIIEPFRLMVDNRETIGFKVLDEVVWLGRDFAMSDFAEAMLERVRYWEAECGRKIMWQHWSDKSAFDRREPISNRYHHQEVFAVTNGKINLLAADKGMNSVKQKVDLLRKLLFQNRIFINRPLCPFTMRMLKSLPKGKNGAAIPRDHRDKHCWDAIMYYVASKCYDEMESAALQVNTGSTSQDALITLG